MTEKVKLTREQANAVKWLTDGSEGSWTQEELIRKHAQEPSGWNGDGDVVDSSVLNGLPLLTLVDALRIGYEAEPKYKVHEWVKTRNGSVGKIVRVGNGFVELDDGSVPCIEFIVHATPEEIKAEQERRVWAGIGREVGVFFRGDVGMHITGSMHYDPFTIGRFYDKGELKGFYPAESFIGFGGGEE